MRNHSSKAVKALAKAIKLAGGQSALAAAINKSIEALDLTDVRKVEQQNIFNWLKRDERVPTEYGHPIEYAVGGKVTRFQLCPGRFVKPQPIPDVAVAP